jgi:hypothetical protein
MLMFILGMLDIVAGVSLVFPSFIGFYVGIIMLLKGLPSLLSLASGDIVIFIMGLVDILAGILLVTSFYIPWFWLIPVVKGLVSLISGLVSS